MGSIDDGQVALQLGDDTYYLKPTIGATKDIGRELGGLVQAMVKVQALDFEAMHVIVKHGLQPDDRLAKRLQGLMYRARIVTLVGPLVEYLMILSNGGQRPAKPQKGQQGDGNEEEGNDGDDGGNGDQAAGA